MRKRIVTLMLAVAALLPLQAQTLNDLDIQVVLSQNGDARIAIRTNVNDAPGPYRIVFRDRASGLTATREVRKTPL